MLTISPNYSSTDGLTRSRHYAGAVSIGRQAAAVISAPDRPEGKGLLDAMAPMAAVLRAPRDGEIIAQGAPADCCLQILEGCVRTVRLLADGRRQVGDFLFAGDVVGWEADGRHDSAAEAVNAVTWQRVKLTAIEAWAARDAMVARRLRQYAAAQMRQGRDRLVALGRKTAIERIAGFLLDMQRRLRVADRAVLELPMNRCDIADYLGLTIETVCRGLTELRAQGIISVDRARIVIHDEAALGGVGANQLH
jgi:CRP/FNR family nitrogen fixation transcriptional regulator